MGGVVRGRARCQNKCEVETARRQTHTHSPTFRRTREKSARREAKPKMTGKTRHVVETAESALTLLPFKKGKNGNADSARLKKAEKVYPQCRQNPIEGIVAEVLRRRRRRGMERKTGKRKEWEKKFLCCGQTRSVYCTFHLGKESITSLYLFTKTSIGVIETIRLGRKKHCPIQSQI